MADKYTSINETESQILHVIAEHQPVHGSKIKALTGIPSGSGFLHIAGGFFGLLSTIPISFE